MLKKVVAISLIGIYLSSCVSKDNLKPIPFKEILHDNNSKVWIIDEAWAKGKNWASMMRKYKETITFFEDGDVFVQNLYTFGTNAGKKGRMNYDISDDSQDTTFQIKFPDHDWDFKVKEFSKSKIVLSPKATSHMQREFTLIPLTKPSK